MRGAILFNGNAETEASLVDAAAPLLLGSRHADPEVAASRRVLLVTAGWAGAEDEEAHVKARLNEIGLASHFEGGYDRAIQNLSLHRELDGVLAASPALEAAWRERGRVVESARGFYLEHNAHLIALARRTVASAREVDPGTSFAGLADDVRRGKATSLLRLALGRSLGQALETLEANDDHLVSVLAEIEQRTFDAAGIAYDAPWREARARLEDRVLSANSIVFFGGHLDLLLDGLRFFRMRDVLAEALRRGAQLVAMSAGAMVLCDRVIVYDDHAEARRDFQLYDRGLGLVRELQLFPHCMERIQTDDADNLAYLARRFRHQTCVGLNQRSFLLLELGTVGDDGGNRKRATSMGDEDGVYAFGLDGRKTCYRKGETLVFDD